MATTVFPGKLSARDDKSVAQEPKQAKTASKEQDGGRSPKRSAALTKFWKLQRQNREEIDRRRAYLDSLYERRKNLNDEQVAVMQKAEEKRQEAAEARKRTVWLASPLHPRNPGNRLVVRGPRMLIVIVTAWALMVLVRFSSHRIARTLVYKVAAPSQRGTNRANKLAPSLQIALTLLTMVSAVLLAFQEAGVEIKTIFGVAAILGGAYAFGARNLMRDYFTGFGMVWQDQNELDDQGLPLVKSPGR